MNYLLYVEHAAENLQFYLWHQDYVKRFNAAATSDVGLSPEWTKAMEDEVVVKLRKEATENARRETAAGAMEIFKGTDFEKKPVDTLPADCNPFATPPPTAVGNGDRASAYGGSVYGASAYAPSSVNTYQSQASDAFAAAGAKTPCGWNAPDSRRLQGHH
jgi:hypothetical protein